MVNDVKSSNISENLMFILNVWNPAWQNAGRKDLHASAQSVLLSRGQVHRALQAAITTGSFR